MHKENTKNDHFWRSSPEGWTHDRIRRRTGNRYRISIHGIHKVWRGSGFHRRGAWLCYGYAFPLFEFPFVSSGLSFSFSFINIPLRLYHIISPLFAIPRAFSFPSSSSPFLSFPIESSGDGLSDVMLWLWLWLLRDQITRSVVLLCASFNEWL
ncbi:hypothetical protein BDV30DRAFT_219720 [Aspergillus minisclerotigenes]|uniref:Uncharacterized protein n=1 Tax=Aspergillus minisclerotigenes TaxID=656917 RepID=A0A5N6IMT8_9EURO|nr:hypothetical protein BDV30DRAFT_219720 [Aspergillus minisclerotigenes]